jgi:cytochrome c heme-lyase
MITAMSDSADSEKSRVSQCPVDHKKAGSSSSLWKVFGISSSPKQPKEESKGLPASLEEAAKHAQTPHPDQRLPLSIHRAESTIPRGKSKENPHHQKGADASNTWVYPSEQQVFNAMKRKGWENVEEESIPSFLQIHNTVNERSWRQLREWESNENIELVRFQGRPDTLTPKAWILSNLLFQDKPFDRHDWFIDNGVNHEKRYVLDYYMTESARTGMPHVQIDVRPALDNPSAVFERVQRLAMDVFPGITKELQKIQQAQPKTP